MCHPGGGGAGPQVHEASSNNKDSRGKNPCRIGQEGETFVQLFLNFTDFLVRWAWLTFVIYLIFSVLATDAREETLFLFCTVRKLLDRLF